METLITLIIAATIGGVVGMAIGDLGGKKNGAIGGLLGALLGPLGWIIVAVMGPNMDGVVPSKTPAAAPSGNDKRIAALEAELQSLKQGPKAKAPRSGADISDDGGVPTYRLD